MYDRRCDTAEEEAEGASILLVLILVSKVS